MGTSEAHMGDVCKCLQGCMQKRLRVRAGLELRSYKVLLRYRTVGLATVLYSVLLWFCFGTLVWLRCLGTVHIGCVPALYVRHRMVSWNFLSTFDGLIGHSLMNESIWDPR